MITAETYPCDFTNCGRVFSKAYEFKKHKAMHENPESVFQCTQCDFITLQKKNLTIHFALHTGEKIYECPDHIVDSTGLPIHRCDFRTHDPAALSKHRKRVHDYIPPPNRRRGARGASASPRKARAQKEENTTRTRRCRSQQRSASTIRRRSSRIARAARNATGAAPGNASSVPLIHVENVDDDAIDVDCYAESDDDASGETWIDGVDDDMQLDTFYDPSLRSNWMAEYEKGYSTFDTSGMKHVPKPLHAPSASADVDLRTGREGCLCPEWMVEAGIEGWNQSVLETHRDLYAF